MSVNVQVWALRVAGLVVLLSGLAVIGVGVVWIAGVTGTDGELDGVATVFGLLACVAGLVVSSVGGIVLFLARRHPSASAVVLCVFGALTALFGWSTLESLGMYLSAPLLLGGLAVGGVGFGVCLGDRSVTIDSRSGISR